MTLTALLSATQLQEALARANRKCVVVQFTATWCAPCKKIKPTLLNLAATHATTFEILTADVDALQDLVTHFRVTRMPTFIFFFRNRVVHVLQGSSTELLSQAFDIISSMMQHSILMAPE